MKAKAVILSVVGVAVVGGGGWLLADRLFVREYRAVVKKTAEYRGFEKTYEDRASGAREVKVGLREAARTMLGAEEAVVEHHLRGMLSEVAERNGLGSVVVTHGGPRAVGSPADERGSRISRELRRKLGERADFAVVRGRVQGLGTLEQCVRTLADLRAQAWVHRIEGFTITPKGRDNGVFELKADYATIYAPDLIEAGDETPGLASPVASDVEALRTIVARAPFAFAEPVAEAPSAPPPPPVVVRNDPSPAPPPPPYDKWRVTGVLESLEGEVGVEVMLYRADTGEALNLRVGQTVLGARLTGASGEQAWFEKDGAPVVVRAGETLDRARPAESVHSDAVGSN